MQQSIFRPAMPKYLSIRAMQGESTCSLDETVCQIWPKFIVMVLLHGSQHFVIDDRHFRVDAGSGSYARPTVLMINVAQYASLRFVNESTVELRKVMMSAPQSWVAQLMAQQETGVAPLRSFFGHHLAHFGFDAPRQIAALAEQMITPPPTLRGELATLHRNARGLDIMCMACAALVAQAEARENRPVLMSLRQSERARDFILGNLDGELTIEEIARAVGASVSALQRHFKDHFGQTVFEFIRTRRLERACAALETEGITIGQASHLAGYANPSSFTTAFKKAYGVSPSQLRR